MPDGYKPRRPRRVIKTPPLSRPDGECPKCLAPTIEACDCIDEDEKQPEPEPAKKLPRLAASQSFTFEEVSWLMQLITILLRGGDARVLMRAPEANRILFKLHSMKERIEKVKLERTEIMKGRM